MSPLALPLLIALVLTVSALLGPQLLRRAAPVMMRIPRSAATLLLTCSALWLLAAAAVSLSLAWVAGGPQILPAVYGDVCQRCLAQTSPFGTGAVVQTPLPVVVLMLLPAAGLAVLAAFGARKALRRVHATRTEQDVVSRDARETRLLGHRVLMLPDAQPVAFALPRRRGGIVVSTGLVQTLSPGELAAVLAHEQAHLRQHHHVVMALTAAFARPLRHVPLFRAVADAVPRYLEIAADDRARGRCGTPSLAGALLKIGEHRHRSPAAVGADPLLHAAGPDRIGHLVAPVAIRTAWLPMTAVIALAGALAVSAIIVHGPYLRVILSGCGIPV